MLAISLSQLFESCLNQVFTIISLVLLVETSNIFHACELIKYQTSTEHIRFEYIVLSVARVASFFHVGSPQKRA